jgi:predicted lipase
VMVPFKQVPSAGRVAFGFDNIYSTMKVVPVPHVAPGQATAAEPELTGSFGDQLEQLALRREAERGVVHEFAAGRTRRDRPTVVTGHSLGSALATLFAIENSAKQKFDISLVSTLASPKVGNLEFKHIFAALPLTSWRIFNIHDVVTKIPPTIPFILDYEHIDVAFIFDSWSFAKKNLGCYHSIETYLHWLNNSLPLVAECVQTTSA